MPMAGAKWTALPSWKELVSTTITAEGLELSLNSGLVFDSGKAIIRPASFPLLDDAVVVLQQYPTLKIRISGHTDDKGKHDFNTQLSLDRANAVKTYLQSKGVGEERIQTRGAGPDEPIADNKTATGRQQNRRIEFELLPQ